MDVRSLARAAVVAASIVLLTAGSAAAHDVNRLDDDGAVNSGKETHAHDQHGGIEGHLPAAAENVQLIGKLDLFAGAEEPGRIADVSAKGNYAYLAVFSEPTCERGGIRIVDISNPARPTAAGYIPSHLGSYAGEGSQVVSLSTRFFKGDLLVYNNEICAANDNGVGGVTLVDVSNPLRPKKLVEGAGDYTVNGKSQTHSNQIHSAFAWQDGEKAYVVLVDDMEAKDVDILDITNPSKPQLISETDLTELTVQTGPTRPHGDAVFHHDMTVKEIDGVQTMLVSYWDGGYVKLNVEDPAHPVFIADTDFAAADPVRLQYGQNITPEGNAHQAEFTRDNEFFLATDEDFNPYRVVATMENGMEFTATQGSDVPQIDDDTTLSGDTRAVGLACETVSPAPADDLIAVIERGVCDFTVKVQNVEAAGYDAAIVFNRTGEDGCETAINMLVEAGIPAVFVSRTDGFRILTGTVPAGYTCSEDGSGTAAPAVGTNGQIVDIHAIFDGWGYVHLYDAATMQEIDQYAIEEGQTQAFASGFGDLSVHEVATDPDEDLAYLSYYAGGLRVLRYGSGGLMEVGKYIAEGGNNFWGVEMHKLGGKKYILGSDRDSGLYIFQYTGP